MTTNEKDLIKRKKILSIPKEEVMISISRMSQTHIIIKREELPEGYSVLDVQYDYTRQCFDFLIVHESFDIIQPQAKIPYLNDFVLTKRTYKIKPYDDVKSDKIPTIKAP